MPHADRCHEFSCSADPTSPKRVRRAVTDVLVGIDGEALATVELLVSELVTNVVLHGGDEMTVRVCTGDDRVRVEVADDGAGLPARREPDDRDDHGRGLGLVESAATAWGVEQCEVGKSVWFELPTG